MRRKKRAARVDGVSIWKGEAHRRDYSIAPAPVLSSCTKKSTPLESGVGGRWLAGRNRKSARWTSPRLGPGLRVRTTSSCSTRTTKHNPKPDVHGSQPQQPPLARLDLLSTDTTDTTRSTQERHMDWWRPFPSPSFLSWNTPRRFDHATAHHALWLLASHTHTVVFDTTNLRSCLVPKTFRILVL
jgi:hypothetical protein